MAIENPGKIGIGTWDGTSIAGAPLNDVERAGFAWHYNWLTSPLEDVDTTPETSSFIPMAWDETYVTAQNLASAKLSGATTLLGFNEPDHPDQAYMTVEQALALWPRLEATGMRLGSPATTQYGTLGSGSWLGRFIAGAESEGLEVDFIATHYYSTDKDVGNFKRWLEAVHVQYDKPIWVTEWALADWANPSRFSAVEQAEFARAGTEMMDNLSFVEKHAWFAAYDGGDGWDLNSGVFDESGALTPVGEAFSSMNRLAPSTTIPAPVTFPVLKPEQVLVPADISAGLVLNVSGDAWLGDAQFIVTVDGRQVGSVRTATASHAAGRTQTFAVDTALSHGPHGISVSFINDAWGGTPSTDRNLFLDGVILNGQEVPGSARAFYSGGTSSFTLTVPVTAPAPMPVLLLAPASESGILGDGITSMALPTLTGTAEPGSTVTLTDTSTGFPVVLDTVLANGAGRWSFTSTIPLADGARSVTATATDAAGNVSPASTALVLTIDTAIPPIPFGLALASASDSGTPDDRRTNDDTFIISGQTTPGSMVALLANGVAIGSAIADATTDTFKVPANTPLALGLNRPITTQTTASGTSALSVPVVVFAVETPEAGISTTDLSFADIKGALDLGARLAFIGGTEAVLLTDSTLSVGTNTNQATIQRLYQGLLGRGNDTGGITYWDDQLNDGVSKAVVAAGFLTTNEYVATHSVQTDEQFITSLYQGLLGRAPEQEGLAAWTGALTQGSSRGDITIGIADSNEAKSHLAPTTAQVYVPNDAGTLTHVLYETGLGREVELPALAYWKAAYDVLTALQLTALIADSPEFTAYHAGQDNNAYVNSLYQAGLGRPAEASGMASWTSLLNSGEATRTDVLLGVATSDEAKAHLTYNLSGPNNS